MHDISPSQATAPRGLRSAGIAAGLVAITVVLAGTLSRARESSQASQWSVAQAIPTVRLISPKPLQGHEELVQPGTIEAWTSARLFARVSGYVRAWHADIGARVRAGEALGSIDTPELDQQIIQASATLARMRAEAMLARTTAARWNDLLISHSVSQQEVDEKNANAATHLAAVREAEASLGRLQAMKSLATLRAPFSGVVTLRNADIGDLVGPGASNQTPMFALADDHKLRIYVSLPQQYAPEIHKGMTATLTVPAWPGRHFTAQLTDQSGAVNPQTGALQVQLSADNADGSLRPGGFVQVAFDLPTVAGSMSLPASALILRTGGTKVATVDGNGHVHFVPVRIARDQGSSVEISAGLAAGTRVIDSPPDSLQEGEAVRVLEGPHG